MVLLAVIVLMAIFVPIFSPYEYDANNLPDAKQGPSWEHPFGTDKTGRDMFTRVWMGTRTSLVIGLLGALIPYVLGMVIGAVSGWVGGVVDMVIKLYRLTCFSVQKIRGSGSFHALPFPIKCIFLSA